MQELDLHEISQVSGGIDQATQVGGQLAIAGIGAGYMMAGAALTPIGAVVFIGVSVALSASWAYYYFS
jgi:hypothetical protein